MDETATRAKRAPRARRAGPMPIARVAALLLAVGAASLFNPAPAARAQQVRNCRSSPWPSRWSVKSSKTTSSSGASKPSTRSPSVRASAAIWTRSDSRTAQWSTRATCSSPSTSVPTRRPMMPPNRKSTSPRACSNSPRCSSIAPTNSAKTGNISTATLDDRRREYLSAQAQMQGATAALTHGQPQHGIHRDQGAACPAASTAGWSRSATSCSRIPPC